MGALARDHPRLHAELRKNRGEAIRERVNSDDRFVDIDEYFGKKGPFKFRDFENTPARQLWKMPEVRDRYPFLAEIGRSATALPARTPEIDIKHLLRVITHIPCDAKGRELYKILKTRDCLSNL